MFSRWIGYAGLAGVLVLSGCSGGSDTAASTSTSRDTWSVQYSSPEAPPEGALGQTLTTGIGVRATPFSFENPTSKQPDADFARFNKEARPWAVLDAELCAGLESKLTKTGYGFSLLDADNREYKSYGSTAQPFTPIIGLSGDLGVGECARGYVSFALPEGVQVVALRWDYPGGGGPLRWTLK